MGFLAVLLVLAVSRPSAAQITPDVPAAQAQAAASLSALSSRIKAFETIYVRTASGEEVAGRFSRASDVSLSMVVHGQTRDIPASDVQQVWLRGGNRVKRGMLVGFLAGAAIADIAAVSSDSRSDLSVGIFLGTVAGGGAGLIWGAIIGAFVHERPLVYRAAAPTVRVTPVLAPNRVGVMASVRF